MMSVQKDMTVTCMMFVCLIVSNDPDIVDIDGKQVIVNKVFIWL